MHMNCTYSHSGTYRIPPHPIIVNYSGEADRTPVSSQLKEEEAGGVAAYHAPQGVDNKGVSALNYAPLCMISGPLIFLGALYSEGQIQTPHGECLQTIPLQGRVQLKRDPERCYYYQNR